MVLRAADMAAKTAAGLVEALHSMASGPVKAAHADIKFSNVMISEAENQQNLRVALVDYGFSSLCCADENCILALKEGTVGGQDDHPVSLTPSQCANPTSWLPALIDQRDVARTILKMFQKIFLPALEVSMSKPRVLKKAKAQAGAEDIFQPIQARIVEAFEEFSTTITNVKTKITALTALVKQMETARNSEELDELLQQLLSVVGA